MNLIEAIKFAGSFSNACWIQLRFLIKLAVHLTYFEFKFAFFNILKTFSERFGFLVELFYASPRECTS